MLGAVLRSALLLTRNGDRMTRDARRLLVFGAAAVLAACVSSCKVLQRASSASRALTTAVANANVPAPSDTHACPLSARDVAGALGGKWTVSSLPSGGCAYADGARSIQASTVPLPKDAAGRTAALARLRGSCTAGSLETISGAAFACREDTLVEAVAVVGGHLLVVCTPLGPDPARLPAERDELATLLAHLAR